jgi:TonB family protein
MSGSLDPRSGVLSGIESDYEILDELGRGGVSVVYLARDRVLGRNVAIKVIRDGFLDDAEASARFEREARMLASLQHPNIVTLFGAKRLAGGSLALVMQHGDWQTLKPVIREHGALPIEQVRRVLTDISSALVYLHRQNVVHRDVKPENIFLERGGGRALLSDFGIARSGDGQASVTLTGVVIGTPAYMSPEQIDGAELSGRSDLYSLGMVAYEMLTGRRPWEGESLYGVIFKQKSENLPPLATQRPDVPRYLQHAVERAIAKNPADRWSDVAAFLDQLDQGGAAAVVQTAPALVVAPRSIEEGEPAEPGEPVHAPAAPPGPERRVPVLALVGGVADGVVRVPDRSPREPIPLSDVARILEEAGAHEERAAGWDNRRYLVAAALVVLLAAGVAGAVALTGGRGASAPPSFALAASPPAAPAPPDARAALERPAPPAPGPGTRPSAAAAPAPLATLERPASPVAAPGTRPAAAAAPAPLPAAPAPAMSQPELPAPVPVLPRSTAVVAPLGGAAPAAAREPTAREPRRAAPSLLNRAEVGRLLDEYYPTELRNLRVTGTVVVGLRLSGSGSVMEAQVETSSGNALLDGAALRIARAMRFSETGAGEADSTWIRIPLVFDAPPRRD